MKRVQIGVGNYSFSSEFEYKCGYCERLSSGKSMIQLTLIRDDGSYKTTIVCSELCQMMTELKWLGD